MKLEFVELAGFRGFRDKTRLEFPGGFTVLTGRNGTGKSTVLDAIDFAITGTISKFLVKDARGGGLDEHIWWVGTGKAEAHYVTVGFIKDNGEPLVVNRSRERGCNIQPNEMIKQLCSEGAASRASIDTLLQTTLIRDELIAALSLDLPEQARFAAVRAAIGGMVGPDYSGRTKAIFEAAETAKNKQNDRIKDVQNELGRLLGDLTEARSVAERSTDITDALQIVESLPISLPSGLTERIEAIRKLTIEKKVALQQIESARTLSRELFPEITYLNSPSAQAEAEAARVAQENASRETTLADERLALAVRLDAAEKESDEHATHMAAILEHGAAVGLQAGHCPLCDAVRTTAEFEAAISSAKARMAVRGEKLQAAAATLAEARFAQSAADKKLEQARALYADLQKRHDAAQQKLTTVRETYDRHGFKAPPGDPDQAEQLFFTEQENLIRLERALANLETSNAIDRVKTLEARVASLRERADQEAAKLNVVERVVESARQIDVTARTVANQILTEQFDTVMPLLKELYKRLRPHADWTEIESDFGGKVRGSLNFTVGDGYNPQFLFSSGQRRAAGLAFLLAVHLSRPWCNWRSLLLDDPVQHIDDYRALNLVEVLAAIRRTGRQVIVSVEDTALANVLCRRLRSASGDIGRIFDLHTSKSGTAEIHSTHDIYPMPQLVLRGAQAS
jgi:chromosome segregation protein